MTPQCPHCGSVIYSRRNVLCGVCGKQLPPELLFTPEERRKVERQLQETDHQKEESAKTKREEFITNITPWRFRGSGLYRWLIGRFLG
jgi:uncharacterized Zn finger protein (UPF0148 family)